MHANDISNDTQKLWEKSREFAAHTRTIEVCLDECVRIVCTNQHRFGWRHLHLEYAIRFFSISSRYSKMLMRTKWCCMRLCVCVSAASYAALHLITYDRWISTNVYKYMQCKECDHRHELSLTEKSTVKYNQCPTNDRRTTTMETIPAAAAAATAAAPRIYWNTSLYCAVLYNALYYMPNDFERIYMGLRQIFHLNAIDWMKNFNLKCFFSTLSVFAFLLLSCNQIKLTFNCRIYRFSYGEIYGLAVEENQKIRPYVRFFTIFDVIVTVVTSYSH